MHTLAMTNPQVVSAVDRWLERAIAPLVAAAVIATLVMWGDVRVIKQQMADMKADAERSEVLDAAQNESLRQLNLRTTILERQNP